MPLGMLVTLDSIFNRVIQNWKKGKTTWIFADEFYLLFRYQYSADFFYRLYKRIRKYQGFVTGLTQNVEELLKSDTSRLMLANSEFLILLNQATTDRDELASLLNISENQLSYITNVGAGKGLIRCHPAFCRRDSYLSQHIDGYFSCFCLAQVLMTSESVSYTHLPRASSRLIASRTISSLYSIT